MIHLSRFQIFSMWIILNIVFSVWIRVYVCVSWKRIKYFVYLYFILSKKKKNSCNRFMHNYQLITEFSPLTNMLCQEFLWISTSCSHFYAFIRMYYYNAYKDRMRTSYQASMRTKENYWTKIKKEPATKHKRRQQTI